MTCKTCKFFKLYNEATKEEKGDCNGFAIELNDTEYEKWRSEDGLWEATKTSKQNLCLQGKWFIPSFEEEGMEMCDKGKCWQPK